MTSLLAVTRVPSVLGAVGGCLSACRTLFTRPQFPGSVALTPTPAPVFSVGGGAGSALLAPCLGLLGAVSGRTNVRNHFPSQRSEACQATWMEGPYGYAVRTESFDEKDLEGKTRV
ncbi:hypothetical protein C7M84_004455 [Penaeus vannamei]|uniref:Uncharacterized protein n=1 Tax=Penaeus vannamei TaxID=6689 RepID=A0A423TKD6_PENVA|nr:uncharacterized protein LOC113805056 [Penaeus vannamei]ROT76928.1 hypothetical protein C7M84_004455 [Penaeus vannamei]